MVQPCFFFSINDFSYAFKQMREKTVGLYGIEEYNTCLINSSYFSEIENVEQKTIGNGSAAVCMQNRRYVVFNTQII